MRVKLSHMHARLFRVLVGVVSCAALPTAGLRAEPGRRIDWSAFAQPVLGPPQAIGSVSAGCLRGAVSLALRDKAYRIAFPQRRRYFGHPQLAAYLKRLVRRAQHRGLAPLVFGDLASPRGGPFESGHSSHQNGLDVDIWYTAGASPLPMVELKSRALTAHWSPAVARLLRLASQDARVSRIFVNPSIKRHLCRRVGGNRGWLRKLRPWWRHHKHFHVRLRCPADSPECKAQAPLPPGDGCEQVAWWFDEEAQQQRSAQGHLRYQQRVDSVPALPAACTAVAEQHARP